jgi:uncharacterized membrane protein HdeD (DUF308 family)
VGADADITIFDLGEGEPMDAATSSKALEQIRSNSGWVIALGAVMMMLGLLAMASPLVTGIAIAWMVGFLVLIGGVTRIVFAFRAQSWGLGILCVLLGGLGILAGLLTLAHPLLGLGFLTLLLAGYLVIEGVTEAIFAFRMRPLPGWGWTLASGVAAIVLGGLIWSQWPLSGAWAVGLLVGIKILFTGSSLMGLGMAARSAPETAAA